MPISFRSAFAAGAASAAAQQDGKTEQEQVQQGEVAALMVDEIDAKKAGEKSVASPVVPVAVNPLDAIATARAERQKSGEAPPHRKPRQPPGPGLLLKIAHWLNLK